MWSEWKIKLKNYLSQLRNYNIYVTGCESIIKSNKKQIRLFVNRQMFQFYCKGVAAPLDLLLKLKSKNRIYLSSKEFRGKCKRGCRLPKYINAPLAYLIGALRDGTLDKYPKGYGLTIVQGGKGSKEWLEKLAEIFNICFGAKLEPKQDRSAYRLRTSIRPIALFFKEVCEMPYNQSSWETPRIIKEHPRTWIWYISGFFDAEGYCTKPKTFRKIGKTKIAFFQNNKKSLDFLQSILKGYGITSYIYKQSKRKCHALYIYRRKDILKFISLIKSIRKRESLNSLRSCFK